MFRGRGFLATSPRARTTPVYTDTQMLGVLTIPIFWGLLFGGLFLFGDPVSDALDEYLASNDVEESS